MKLIKTHLIIDLALPVLKHMRMIHIFMYSTVTLLSHVSGVVPIHFDIAQRPEGSRAGADPADKPQTMLAWNRWPWSDDGADSAAWWLAMKRNAGCRCSASV